MEVPDIMAEVAVFFQLHMQDQDILSKGKVSLRWSKVCTQTRFKTSLIKYILTRPQAILQVPFRESMLMSTPEDSQNRENTQHGLNFSVMKTETNTESPTLAIVDTGYKVDSTDHKVYGEFRSMNGNLVQC
jgi:hypothetical protein